MCMADTMPHSLINPNQLRAYGVDVEDNPSRGPLYIADAESDIRIPLRMVGTNILFDNRTPTQEELETCRRIELSNQFERQPASSHERFDIHVASVQMFDSRFDNDNAFEMIYNPDSFARNLIGGIRTTIPSTRKVQAVLTDTTTPNTFVSSDRRVDVTPQSLSDRWMIGLMQAELTLKNTTQRSSTPHSDIFDQH